MYVYGACLFYVCCSDCGFSSTTKYSPFMIYLHLQNRWISNNHCSTYYNKLLYVCWGDVYCELRVNFCRFLIYSTILLFHVHPVHHICNLRAKLSVACLVTPALWLNLSDSRNILIIDSIGHDLWKKYNIICLLSMIRYISLLTNIFTQWILIDA